MQFLLNIPKETLYISMGIVLGAICALHIIASFCSGILSKLLQYVNIFLHILLFPILLLAEIGISYSVAFYMASLYLYVSIGAFAQKRKRRKEKENDL